MRRELFLHMSKHCYFFCAHCQGCLYKFDNPSIRVATSDPSGMLSIVLLVAVGYLDQYCDVDATGVCPGNVVIYDGRKLGPGCIACPTVECSTINPETNYTCYPQHRRCAVCGQINGGKIPIGDNYQLIFRPHCGQPDCGTNLTVQTPIKLTYANSVTLTGTGDVIRVQQCPFIACYQCTAITIEKLSVHCVNPAQWAILFDESTKPTFFIQMFVASGNIQTAIMVDGARHSSLATIETSTLDQVEILSSASRQPAVIAIKSCTGVLEITTVQVGTLVVLQRGNVQVVSSINISVAQTIRTSVAEDTLVVSPANQPDTINDKTKTVYKWALGLFIIGIVLVGDTGYYVNTAAKLTDKSN